MILEIIASGTSHNLIVSIVELRSHEKDFSTDSGGSEAEPNGGPESDDTVNEPQVGGEAYASETEVRINVRSTLMFD